MPRSTVLGRRIHILLPVDIFFAELPGTVISRLALAAMEAFRFAGSFLATVRIGIGATLTFAFYATMSGVGADAIGCTLGMAFTACLGRELALFVGHVLVRLFSKEKLS